MDVVNPEQVRLSALASSLCVPLHEHREESRTTGLTWSLMSRILFNLSSFSNLRRMCLALGSGYMYA